MISPGTQTTDFLWDMSSAHLSNTIIPHDHRLSRATEMEGIEETLPRSFAIVADSDLRRESLRTEVPSKDQSLFQTLPFSASPKRRSLSQSKEISGVVAPGLEMPPANDTSNGTSNPASVRQTGQPNASDNPVPRRALCEGCDEWITTKDAAGNDNGNWAQHITNCVYLMVPREASPSVAGDASTSISETPGPTADSSEPRDNNTAFRRRKVKHYESERLALLQRDPQAEEVEEYRVLCGFCEKWIQLRKDRPYCPIAWTAHKLQCVNRRRKPGSVSKKVKREHLVASVVPYEMPSPPTVQIRRTEEERLRFLESDPHATTVEPHRILCGICRRWIQLRKNSTYCTAPWVQHVKKCAIKHDTPRQNNETSAAYPLDEDGEDEIESEDGAPRHRADPIRTPTKRGRGRPRKHKSGEQTKDGQTSFALRPVSGGSPSPPGNRRESRRSSASPPSMRTPSPPLAHPYAHDMYWYPALPPMSSYYPLYAGSQYNESDDSYSLYFHAQPPAHQSGPTPGQGRFRAKPPKHTSLHSGGASGPGIWHGGPSPSSGPLGSIHHSGPSHSPGPEGAAPQPGRTWIVWRLKDYSTNPCPMDPTSAPVPHTSAPSEASGSGSSSGPLPMFRSGTWPHLLDPEDPARQQNLSPYVHPELGAENGGTSSARPPSFSQLSPPPPPPRPQAEDPALNTFNSSAHIPIRRSESHVSKPPTVPDPNIDPRFSMHPPLPTAAIPPDAPTGPDLDSPECRLVFTFQAIAYLFSTSFQGADDMSLETLMAFMNRTIPHDKRYDGQEVSQHVAILGERKQLVFTKEGGVQLLTSPPP